MKELFLLDPDITFLNHGSFGACPRPVFETYQHWQRRLELQPVQFIARELFDYLAEARGALGKYLNAPADDLAFIPNATFGVNVVTRSLDLQPGDQVLTTDHEYGACLNTWQFIAKRTGAEIVKAEIELPVASEDEIIDRIWQGVTERTRLIFISHITSGTAMRFPVEAICQLARQHGILTCVDGAHAPGQIDLDLSRIGADFYTGNCHKWMLAPKGSAFLYARPEVQSLIEPLIVSWGWGEHAAWERRTPFLDNLEYWGTKDFSAYLSVPAAIEFMQTHNWPQVRVDCHKLLTESLLQLHENLGTQQLVSPNLHAQMGILQLPEETNIKELQSRLWQDDQIEVPCSEWNGHKLMRISVQAYNRPDDLETLFNAICEGRDQ